VPDEAAEAGDTASVPKKPRYSKRLRDLGLIVAAAIVLTLLLKAFVMQVYEIPSPSMENTLMVGDRVLVNKLVYHFRDIARGDIIVFSGAGSWGDLNGDPIPPPPSNPFTRFFDAVAADVGIHGNNTFYIKRVIGLPGDHVACCTNGMITVNGVPLHESSYLMPGTYPAAPVKFSIVVPAGRLWVMGDNRDDSADSLYHYEHGSLIAATIPENEVAGRAFFVAWPLSQFGDLPIPATFQQAGIDAAPAAAATTLAAAPLLIWRRRRKSRP
jgi:signal peptidase I